ncbi:MULTISPECIES: hypothetical protein [Leptospira]|uniref:SMI1/KNR4 domain protein n=2 Tax=Leptospira borgpetersenii TaxID=174 RepID=M3HJL9_LEPBO|nr:MULTISPECIES: hypothetical protein [Leptospira]EMF98300.1 hypothetical protein LEP1GSC123_1654 [Leptospira borgpetersenii str. 200701203]EMK13432.1 hypothetical protein LEP1GSC066_2171 [Leptospira sp. serovar Kenya str. Sh9]ENO64824.1 hypothetical protein LEP1GSC191_1605 [Leptospira borgpetersenii serovar Mini str. 201000851]
MKKYCTVMQGAVKATCTKEKIVIKFHEIDSLTAFPPLTKIPSKYPKSYQKILSRHELIRMESDYLWLGDHKYYNEDEKWWFALGKKASILLKETHPKDIITPMLDSSDQWLFHTQDTNTFGEPIIYYLSHEGVDIEDPQPYNIGSLFLKRFAEIYGINIEIPIV